MGGGRTLRIWIQKRMIIFYGETKSAQASWQEKGVKRYPQMFIAQKSNFDVLM